MTQAKKNVWIVSINGKEPNAEQGALDELQGHQTQRGKYKFNISLYRSKRYQRTDLEEIWSIFDQLRPLVSHLEVILPEKPLTPKNIGEDIKGPQTQLRKEDLSVQYRKNKNINLILYPIPIKSLLYGTKVLHSLIAPSIREGDCFDVCKFVARHCENGSSHIQGVGFDQSHSPVAHADYSIINISSAALHRLAARILDISNYFHNANVPIHERVCVGPPPYYLDRFE